MKLAFYKVTGNSPIGFQRPPCGINAIDTSNRPPYIEEEFYRGVAWQLKLSKENLNQHTAYPQSETYYVEQDRVGYLENLISGNKIETKKFYQDYGHDAAFLNDVLCLFSGLPEWHHSYKTSGKFDRKNAESIANALKRASQLLHETVEVRLNLQWQWEKQIIEIINDGCKGIETDAGRKAKEVASKMTFPNLSELKQLNSAGYTIPTNSFNGNTKSDLSFILMNLARYLDEIAPLAEEKDYGVTKLKAEEAHIHYAVRELKKCLTQSSIPTRKHVKCIAETIYLITGEDYSEDHIRKLLR